MTYLIEQHRHRVAAWGAATAARASKLCRFKVSQGVKILEDCGFDDGLASPQQLPNPGEIDQKHHEWRVAIIHAAATQQIVFTHGIAAKLINSYLKVRFVCGGHHEHERVRSLHPPVDALLLKELSKQNFGGFEKQWRQFHEKCWSKFDSDTYQSVVEHIRKALPAGEPLWMIEEYWKGYQ